MSLVISDDILRAANMSASDLRREIAALLFQQDKLTLGQASEFAGMSELEFQRLLAKRHIAIHYDVQETPMTDPTAYNYTIFVGQGDFDSFPSGPRVGSLAPDFTAILLETGQQVRLSDYWRERDVLVEFGSYT